MSEFEFQVLQRIKSTVTSVKANWGFPATTPVIDRLMTAVSQVRARVATLRRGVAAPAPAAPAAGQFLPEYPYTEYQVIEEKPEVK